MKCKLGKICAITALTALSLAGGKGYAADRTVTVTSHNGLKIITHKNIHPSATAAATEVQEVAVKPNALFIPAVYNIESAWAEQSYDFSKSVPEPVSSGDIDYSYETPVGLEQLAIAYGGGDHKSDGKEMLDRLIKKIPYKNTLKYTWDVIDGDVDLGVKNLRVDRGNKGITYKTNHIPMLGEMEGTQIKAEAGEDTKLTLTSDRVPFGNRVEGLRFKASVGNDDSNISLRYQTSIDVDIQLDKTHQYQSTGQ